MSPPNCNRPIYRPKMFSRPKSTYEERLKKQVQSPGSLLRHEYGSSSSPAASAASKTKSSGLHSITLSTPLVMRVILYAQTLNLVAALPLADREAFRSDTLVGLGVFKNLADCHKAEAILYKEVDKQVRNWNYTVKETRMEEKFPARVLLLGQKVVSHMLNHQRFEFWHPQQALGCTKLLQGCFELLILGPSSWLINHAQILLPLNGNMLCCGVYLCPGGLFHCSLKLQDLISTRTGGFGECLMRWASIRLSAPHQ